MTNVLVLVTLIIIVSFANKETEEFWLSGVTRRLPLDARKRAYARLQSLNAAKDIKDLMIPPSHQLEKLKGDRKNQYSIRVNKQWRICFIWKDGEAHEVEFVDYH